MPRFGDDYGSDPLGSFDGDDDGTHGELDRIERFHDRVDQITDSLANLPTLEEFTRLRESAAAQSSSTAKPKEGSTMTAAQPIKPSTAPPVIPSRMTLANVQKGKRQRPHRVIQYGPEGIGKSSFAAGAPKPIFIPVEDGTDHLDVERFPKPDSWKDLRAAVRELGTAKHDYQTLVIDTLDAAEALLWKHMIERDVFVPSSKGKEKLRDIEDYGYGKGYGKALEDWRGLLKDIELLQLQRGMHFVGIAHSQVKTFKNPAGGDFDRYELKVNNKAAGLFKEWSDTVLFANYETFAKKDEANPRRVRGLDTGARLLFTERRAAYDAKHRGHLPDQIPLSWADFANECAKEIDPKAFAEAITRRAAELGDEFVAKVADTLKIAGNNVQSLININNRVNARIAEASAEKEES